MSYHHVAYGSRHSQHGELWMPDRPPDAPITVPVVVLLHGGFWKAMYTKRLMTPLASDVTQRGWAAWNLEYRRVGSFSPGGWPATFDDVAAGIDHLGALAAIHHLDLDRVVAVGHSAGGHLALWAAGRGRLPPGAPGASVGVRLRGVVGLGAVSDLVRAASLGLGGGAVARLLGGGPERRPERYAVADPIVLLPLGVPQALVHGDRDGAVPVALSRGYVERAVAAGDRAVLAALPGVGHMELIDPDSPAWAAAVTEIERLLG